MIVTLRYKTADIPEGRHKYIKDISSVKEAEVRFKTLAAVEDITEAWLTHFDGWHHVIKKVLKRKTVDK